MPHTSAAAAPGITPWASASPRKVRPRSTTQVPTSDDATTTSSPDDQRAQHLVGFDPRGRVVEQDPHVTDDMEDGYHSQITAVTATDLALAYDGPRRRRGRDLHDPRARRSPR